MKKYVKPDLYYEDFHLSVHIATCAWDMSNYKSIAECSAAPDGSNGLPAESMNAFMNNANCVDGPIEDFCYTNGADGINIFNS